MLFDTNRNGAINDLVTTVPAGSKIVWRRDRRSGIKRLLSVYPKSKDSKIFRNEPRRCWFFNIFWMKVPKDVEGEEAYNIDYLLCDKKKVTIDPIIRVPPPRSDG